MGDSTLEFWQNQFSGEPKRLLYLPFNTLVWARLAVNTKVLKLV
jgi:hypothetical protein